MRDRGRADDVRGARGRARTTCAACRRWCWRLRRRASATTGCVPLATAIAAGRGRRDERAVDRRPPASRRGSRSAHRAARGSSRRARTVRELGLHTVCEEARCPNIGECWGHRTATFMLLGDTCTRNCSLLRRDARPPARRRSGGARRASPRRWRGLGLRHVVITSVNRDDLPDGGAAHFAATARAVQGARRPDCRVEVLVPDFQGDRAAVATVVASPIDVFNHNIETVPRLYKRVRPGARYERSLAVLAPARSGCRPALLTKAGLMLGLGESETELTARLQRLTRGRVRHPDARSVPAAVAGAPAGRALRPAGGVRPRCVGPRIGARFPARRVRPAGAQLVPRAGRTSHVKNC